MGKSKYINSSFIVLIFAILVLFLAACSGSSDDAENAEDTANNSAGTEEKEDESTEDATIEITDAHGTVAVPVNPQNVVALDNRTFETLADWGIELAAAPVDLIPEDNPYKNDDSIQNIGNHREPNLEIIAAVDPELVIVGQRFASYYEDIKALVPNAVVIDLNIDVSEEAETPGDNLVNGFKDITTSLGQIFDKNEEAEALIAEFDQSIEEAKAAYNGTDRIMSVIVSGGDINFAAPQTGRVWGPLYDIFGWTSALEIDQASADHQGDDISVEAIAETDPDWIFVMDRDAAVSSETDAVPARDVIDGAPALQNTTAVKEGQIVYAPADTYTNESIQTFTELFNDLAEALAE
ncbi:siderophore ABC transporter substrate-binding protein [Oceanobacillus luteolus]|mgnify:CR=1 FL=1|uniref:Siderophore ABC transporter substrate-binding protein n=1 Tax=Oceanobacillus luteolus TaxID=1274358 RepID=A0ABW4HM93_9BACI|nr:siderophore ABC transporter substrate-binding protein [Oceanobacillus luteolus]MCM3740505.1 siderophore ABC transporter substrate-binding protein [Oceanobacillus luteolus]